MGNHADDCGTDVEIYRKALSAAIHADTRTGAPEQLLALLDSLGLERKTITAAGPDYVWHEVPEDLSEKDQKRLATRAIPTLLMAGYKADIASELFDSAAYIAAANQARVQGPASAAPAAAPPTGTARPGRGV